MKAIEIAGFGPPEVLELRDRPTPNVSAGEILIQVEAAGVARADILQREGKYPPPHGSSDVPGLDVAGIVEAVGDGVTAFRVGDKVCAILTGGGYAEYCVVPAVQALPIPQNWNFEEAVTLPENLFTAYDNVVTRAGLKTGETILIHGGSSGVGTTATMLAVLFDARIIVTAGSHEKCDACLRLGAHEAINYKTSANFSVEVMRITDGRGVDVILDMVGGSYLSRNLASLANEGRIVMIATQGGSKAELDIAMLLKKRARVMGSTMRARSAAEKGAVAQALLHEIWPKLPAKTPIRPVIDSVFPLAAAAAAHSRMESNQTIGKVVLSVGGAGAQGFLG